MTKQVSSLPAQILAASSLKAREDHLQDARPHVDELFPDLDELLEHAHVHIAQDGGESVSLSSVAAGAIGSELSRTSSRTGTGHAYQPGRRGKRRRTLNEEIAHWEREEAAASAEVEKTSKSLPALLAETQTKLQTLLSTAQKLSLERHTLTDQLSGLVDGLDAPVQYHDGAVDGGADAGATTLLQQMADLQDELARLEAGLTWATVLEKVLSLSEKALAPSAHSPSPLAALPIYGALHNLVDDLLPSLPGSMALVGLIVQIRETTWMGLQDALSRNLLNACDTIKWPTKISYQALPPQERRTFERAFTDMLFFQAEGQALRDNAAAADWTFGSSVLPVAVLAKPVELRFQYHFMGNKSTNRLDKASLLQSSAVQRPEWAFASLLDTLYQQSPFLTSTLTTLTRCSDALFRDIDIRAEFTLSLLSTALSLLRSRIPKILDKPSLLAHTIYQTIVFDDAIRQGGFDLARTMYGRRLAGGATQLEGADGQSGAGDEQVDEWQGLTGVALRESGWYETWVKGEKQFVDTQMHDIIASSDAWTITDEAIDEDDGAMDGQRPTVSARQVKALIEQVTVVRRWNLTIADRYLPLPELRHRLPFLLSIQLPALQAYHQRISGSLDAFENLSSAFARAIPGALSGNTRGGAHFDQSKLTGGEAGLARLIKAQLSAAWLVAALRGWADEPFFVELSADAQKDTAAKWTVQSDAHLSFILDAPEGASVFDRSIQQFEALCDRAQDMMIRLVTVEVESHLREHLKRRWDSGTGTSAAPSAHLLSALSTYSTLLRLLATDLPPLIVSRLYRRIVSHLSNHIFQRAVYSGWSKFTAEGGKEFAHEVRDFVSASTDIMSSAPRTGNPAITASVASVEAPWRVLSDASRVLQLPEHERQGKAYEGEVTFKQAMAAAWADGEESLRVFSERSGTRMGRVELQGILRRRLECWK